MFVKTYWFLLIAVAALSHAIWNFLLKQSEDKTIFLWSLRIWAVICFLPVGIAFWPKEGIPLRYLFLWGFGSIVLHGIYAKVLAKAYEFSDFSLAYPVARGLGPLIIVIIGVTILKENISPWTLMGSLVIFIGVYVLYSGLSVTSGLKTLHSLAQNPFPIFVGISIAGYTIFDKLAIAYVPAIILTVIENAGQVVMLSPDVKKKEKEVLKVMWKKSWPKMAVAGFLSAISYLLILITLSVIPVSKVAPIRESGIVVGALLGFIFLEEKFNVQKVIGSVMIFLGVIAIVYK